LYTNRKSNVHAHFRGYRARFGKRSLIIILLGVLIFSVFTRLVSFGFRSLQSISRVLAAPWKRVKIVILICFSSMSCIHTYLPVKSHSNTAWRTTNPRDQLKRHSIQTFKEFNFNYFTVNLLSIFISNSINSSTQTRTFQTFSFWSVYCSSRLFAYLGIRTASVVSIKHYCNFHYYFYESGFFYFSFRACQLVL